MEVIDRIKRNDANDFFPKRDSTVNRPQRRLFFNCVPDEQSGIVRRASSVNPRQPSQEMRAVAVGHREEFFRVLFMEGAKQKIRELGRIRP